MGCTLASHLGGDRQRILILERESGLLLRASYANQARVHNGYHYPRSLLTALRSRVNAPRFLDEYHECVDRAFTKVYAIGRVGTKVSAGQFTAFCARIGARLERAPAAVRRLFNPLLVEDVFLAQEYAFDPVKLAARLRDDLSSAGVEVQLGCSVTRVAPAGERVAVHWQSGGDAGFVTARQVYNCTYSELNRLLSASSLPSIPLRHELAELALVDVPPPLDHMGITIMDGPFWSLMPFPARGVHTLSHVRYTPHYSWEDHPDDAFVDRHPYARRVPPPTKYAHMIKDAERYVPALRDCRYVDSLFEVKTVLPSSDVDDSRPILFRAHHGLRNFTCVLGAKIDNIYDVLAEMTTERQEVGAHGRR